ncbi:hypothetical protein [Achromobacter sp.]
MTPAQAARIFMLYAQTDSSIARRFALQENREMLEASPPRLEAAARAAL